MGAGNAARRREVFRGLKNSIPASVINQQGEGKKTEAETKQLGVWKISHYAKRSLSFTLVAQ